MTIIFLHGFDSTPGGVKPTFLAQHGHKVLNPALPDDDFDDADKIAQDEFDRHRPSGFGSMTLRRKAPTCPNWSGGVQSAWRAT
jgi:hypothetical protein